MVTFRKCIIDIILLSYVQSYIYIFVCLFVFETGWPYTQYVTQAGLKHSDPHLSASHHAVMVLQAPWLLMCVFLNILNNWYFIYSGEIHIA